MITSVYPVFRITWFGRMFVVVFGCCFQYFHDPDIAFYG